MELLFVLFFVLIVCFSLANELNSVNQSYTLSRIEATTCMPKCLECKNGPNSCTKCSDGANCCNWACIQCQNQITCRTCKQDFKLDEKLNVCVSQYSCDDFFCDECIEETYICKKCHEGYFLNSQMLICEKCQQKCILCENLDNCTACMPKTYLSNGTCLNCQQNCQQCSNFTVCLFCAESYYINEGKCTKCIDSCVKCNSGKDCQQCISRYYYDNDSYKCLPCQARCKQCKNYNECVKCDSEYFYNKTLKTCQTCDQYYPNCLTCHNTTEIVPTVFCMQCQPKYFVVKNKCSPCPQNCLQCQSNTFCKICSQGYFINQSYLCEPCKISFCIMCEKRDICKICQPKYYWSDDVSRLMCLKCPYGCNSCDKFVCKSCANGFYLKNGNCHKCDISCYSCVSEPNHCNICMLGYFKIQIDWGKCIKCPQPCLECRNITSCKSCLHGFYLENNACKKCQITGCDQCQLTQNDSNSLPILSDSNQQTTKTCIRCSQSYFLNNSTCNKCIDGCKQCNQLDLCNQCHRGYSRNSQGTICAKCPQHSVSCRINPVTSQVHVEQCQLGYVNDKTSKECIPCQKNCKFCILHDTGFCLDCYEGYYRHAINSSGQQCLPCQSPCKTCESASDCMTCLIGYYMNQKDECAKCGQGCEECNQQGCFVCQQGYRLQMAALKCQKCKVKNCMHCRQSVDICQTCQDGYTYYKTQTNNSTTTSPLCYRCDQSIEGCKSCSSPYICTQCFSGLTLLNQQSNDNSLKSLCQVSDKSSNDILFYVIIGGLGLLCLILIIVICIIKKRASKMLNNKVVKPNQIQTLIQTSQQTISPIDIFSSSREQTNVKKSGVFSSFAGIN